MAKLVSGSSSLVSYHALLPQNPDTLSNLVRGCPSIDNILSLNWRICGIDIGDEDEENDEKRLLSLGVSTENAGSDMQPSQERANYLEPSALTRIDVPKHPDARRPPRRYVTRHGVTMETSQPKPSPNGSFPPSQGLYTIKMSIVNRSSSCPTSGGVINSGAESNPSVTATKAPSSNYQFRVPMSQDLKSKTERRELQVQ
jgi:hypothetical protein